MYSDNELAIIAIDSIIELEYKYKLRILQIAKEPKEFINNIDVLYEAICKVVGCSLADTVKLCFKSEFIKSQVKQLNESGVTAITYLSENYPEQLKSINIFPLILYAKGNVNLLKEDNLFGIVGSRKTLPFANKLTTDFSKELAMRGAVIVSGSALGADRAALIGAKQSKRVISVLAHGHDRIYPESNRDLVEQISNEGLVISEYPPKIVARSWMFPVRNRIIAGLCKGVLIVSGEYTSGARHTANFAVEYGRDVFALPYSIGVKSGELCNDLIKNGAYLFDKTNDVDSCLNLKPLGEKITDLDERETAVLNLIKEGVEDVKSLLKESKLKIFELTPIISALELKGYVVKMLGNKFKSVK